MQTTMRRCGFAAAAAILCAASAAGAGNDPPAAIPFPVDKTRILKVDDAVYFVEGRRTIPQGVEVTVLKGAQILGRGKDATLVVEGGLKIHGVTGLEVAIEGVTVEPAAKFDAIRIDEAIFRKGGGIRTAAKVPCDGYFMLELLDFTDTAALDVTVAKGSVEMSNVCSETPVSLVAVDDPTTHSNTVRFEIRGCVQGKDTECRPHTSRCGLRGGLVVEAANEIVVRMSRLGGALASIRDWRKSLIFDGNKVDARRLEFIQPVAGRFKVAQLFKCDVYSPKVVFTAPPAKAGETEEIQFERFCFANAGLDEKAVEAVVEDAADAPGKNGVRVKITKLNERPLGLAGSIPK